MPVVSNSGACATEDSFVLEHSPYEPNACRGEQKEKTDITKRDGYIHPVHRIA